MTHRDRQELTISIAVLVGFLISVFGCFMVSVSVGIIGLGLAIVLACVLKIK